MTFVLMISPFALSLVNMVHNPIGISELTGLMKQKS